MNRIVHFLRQGFQPSPQLALANASYETGLRTHSSLNDIIGNWSGLLFAVPKRRTTRSRKRMRHASKWLKRKHNLVTCTACGNKHEVHHLCLFCFPFNKWVTGKDGAIDRFLTNERLNKN
eukprot:maker-scaffold_2-snap-gene-21.60-mRNA-1 protein AED:0.00 eAED:0.00 QI:52/1/1/1/1/1/2/15/119